MMLLPRVTFANFSQPQAKWDGAKDPNSGSYSLAANLTFKLKSRWSLTPGYRYPVAQQTLSDEGDTFEYEPTFTYVGLGWKA